VPDLIMLLFLFAGASVELAPPSGRLDARGMRLGDVDLVRPVQAATTSRANGLQLVAARPSQASTAGRLAFAGMPSSQRPRQ
jgi:hypothetical protein